MRTDVLDPAAGRPAHVVGFLFDGVNPNVLYAMAAAGEAPNVARLIEMGTAYEWGAMAGLPTVTLANHTSILTGRLPGHHGILHNAWFDRATGEQVITNSQATWPWAMEHLTPGVESLHDVDPPRRAGRVHRVGQRALRPRCRLLDLRLLPPRRGAADPRVTRGAAAHDRAVRAPVEGLLVVVGRRPHGRRAGRRHLERPLPRPVVPDADVHVVQLHPHRLRVPRGGPVLGDRGGVGARLRRARRRRARRRSSAPACSTTPRSCWSPTTACRRPIPRCAATGTSSCAPPGIEFRDEGYCFLYLD